MKVLEKLFGKAAVAAGNYGSRFRCVRVHAGAGACHAARRIDGELYFPDDIPKLPLEGCDNGNCACGYELRDDRRTTRRDETNKLVG